MPSFSKKIEKVSGTNIGPQKTTNFARQVADPPGESESNMKIIYIV